MLWFKKKQKPPVRNWLVVYKAFDAEQRLMEGCTILSTADTGTWLYCRAREKVIEKVNDPTFKVKDIIITNICKLGEDHLSW